MSTSTEVPVPAIRQRAFATGVSFSLFGLMNVALDVVPQKVPNAAKGKSFRLACPTCTGSVSQFYACADGHGRADGMSFTEVDLIRAREVDGVLVPFTDEEVAAVREAGEVSAMTIAIHPAAQVEAATRVGEAGYRLRPGKKAKATEQQVYGVLRALAADPELAFVGTLLLPKTSEKVYRITVWNDQLVMHELIRPEMVAPADDVSDAVAPDPLVAQAQEMAKLVVTEFEAAQYHDGAVDRLAAALEAKATGETPVVAAAVVAAESSLEAMLARAVEAAKKPATSPRKPRARKAKAKPEAAETVEEPQLTAV